MPFPASARCTTAETQSPADILGSRCEGACDAVDHAKIALSTAGAAPNSPPRSSIRRRLRRPAHPPRKPPHRQIPIDGKLSPGPRGSLPGRLSDAGPQRAQIGHHRPASQTLHLIGQSASARGPGPDRPQLGTRLQQTTSFAYSCSVRLTVWRRVSRRALQCGQRAYAAQSLRRHGSGEHRCMRR